MVKPRKKTTREQRFVPASLTVRYRDKKGRFVSPDKRTKMKLFLWVGKNNMGYRKWTGEVLNRFEPRLKEQFKPAPVTGKYGKWTTMDFRKRKGKVLIDDIVKKLKTPLYVFKIEMEGEISWKKLDDERERKINIKRKFHFIKLCVPRLKSKNIKWCIAEAMMEEIKFPQITYDRIVTMKEIDGEEMQHVTYKTKRINYTFLWLRYRMVD